MEKPKKIKRTLLWIIGSIVFLAGLTIAMLMILGPIIGDTFFCTLAECAGGLKIQVIGLANATPYKVILSYSSREEGEILTCVLGVQDYKNDCVTDGAVFWLASDSFSLPPEEVTVTIVVGENRISKVFHPEYEKIYPNGKNCSPTCYSALIVFDVLEK